MENLNKTQKIVLYIVGGLVIILIIIYIFTKDNDNIIYSNYNSLYLEENEIKENSVEEVGNIICVYVTGEVNNSSVVELKEGARVADAIEKAGGLTDSGEVKDLNLAYKLKDGEKLYIPSLDEVIESKENNTIIQYISSAIVNNSISNNNASVSDTEFIENDNNNTNELININNCTQTELETLEGIGPSTAQKIIEYRKENGPFRVIEDIKNVSGIGDAKYEGIKDKICVR